MRVLGFRTHRCLGLFSESFEVGPCRAGRRQQRRCLTFVFLWKMRETKEELASYYLFRVVAQNLMTDLPLGVDTRAGGIMDTHPAFQ